MARVIRNIIDVIAVAGAIWCTLAVWHRVLLPFLLQQLGY
jgi:hypothetical protein